MRHIVCISYNILSCSVLLNNSSILLNINTAIPISTKIISSRDFREILYTYQFEKVSNLCDLLFYNIELKCYVVIELKVTELKKEHIGQIEVYMNYIDNNLKKITQDKTIGIIICKKDNHFIMEYCSDKRILSREYQLG